MRKRVLIVTMNDELKHIVQTEHSGHRPFNNFIANALSGIAAYGFFEKKPAIELNFLYIAYGGAGPVVPDRNTM